MTHISLWGHGLLIGAIVIVAGVGHRAPRAFGTLLVVLSLLWLRHNEHYEAAVVWSISPSKGLTTTDFVGLGGLVVAAYLWGSWFWSRRR